MSDDWPGAERRARPEMWEVSLAHIPARFRRLTPPPSKETPMPRPGHYIHGVQTVCQRCGTDCYQTMRCSCCRADEGRLRRFAGENVGPRQRRIRQRFQGPGPRPGTDLAPHGCDIAAHGHLLVVHATTVTH